MQSTEIENILIYVDEAEFDRHLHLIRGSLIPVLNRIKEQFEMLNLGNITNEYLNDILFNECRLIKKQVTANKLNGLLLACEELEHPGNFEFELIKDFPSVDDEGNIILSPEAIEGIREMNSIYAMTNEGQELMKAHREAAEALNTFFRLVKQNINPTPESISELFSVDRRGNIEPVPREYDFYFARQSQQPL